MTARTTIHAPSLRVTREGVAAASSGSFAWIVHRRPAPVAFLASPLMALGEGEELHASVELEAGASAALTGQGPTTFLKTGRRVVQRQEFDGRPRMGLTVSTNGSQLYIHTAGPTIDVYDAATLRLIRTVEYRADMTDIVVVPAGQ